MALTFDIKTEMIGAVLEENRTALSDSGSAGYQIINCFLEMENNEDNFIIFYAIFRDLYDNVYTLGDIVNYLNRNELEVSMESLDAFLNDMYTSIRRQRETTIYKKLLFGKYSNGIFIEFMQSLFDKTAPETSINGTQPISFIRAQRDDDPLFWDYNHWLAFPLIDYAQKVRYDLGMTVPFRDIREAEIEYTRLFERFLSTQNQSSSFLERDLSNTYLEKVQDEINSFDNSSWEDWFVIERRFPFFLRKVIQKADFHYNADIDDEIKFSLKRSSPNYLRGMSMWDLFEQIDNTVSGLVDYIVESGDTTIFDNTQLLSTNLIRSYLDYASEEITNRKTLIKYIFDSWLRYFFLEKNQSGTIELMVRNATINSKFDEMSSFYEFVENWLQYIVSNDKRFYRGGYR